MGPFMLIKVRLLRERLPTDRADEGLKFRVRPLVLVQIRLL